MNLPGKDTQRIVPALARHMRSLAEALRRSLTWDRGLELAHRATFTVATDVQPVAARPGDAALPTAQVRRRRSPASATKLTTPIATPKPRGDSTGAVAPLRAQLGTLARVAQVSKA